MATSQEIAIQLISRQLINEGIAGYSEGNYSEAFQLFNEALSRDTEQGIAYFYRGLIFAIINNYQEAIKDFNRAIEIQPKEISLDRIYDLRGNCYEDLGDREKAIKDYEKAIEINPSLVSAHHRRGSILSIWGMMSNDTKVDTTERLTLAVEEFDFVIQCQPENIHVYEQRGRTRALLDDEVGAIEDFSICIQHNPNDYIAYQQRAHSFTQLGRNKDALNDWYEMLEICLAKGDTESCETANFFIKSCENKEDSPKSLTTSPQQESEFDFEARELEIRSANTSSNSQATSYLNSGAKLYNQGELTEAISVLQQAIKVDPNYAMAYFILGRTLQSCSLLDEAVQVFTKAIEINPKDSCFYGHLGLLLADLGRLPEALEVLQKAVYLNTEMVGVYRYIADILQEQGNIRDAIQGYKKAIILAPDTGILYSRLGSLLSKYKYDKNEAIEMFYKAVEVEPDDPDVYFQLAFFLDYQERKAEALPLYKEAKSLYEAKGDRQGVVASEKLINLLS